MMDSTVKTHDAIVIGGGMVGAAAAIGLAMQGRSVAVVEHDAPAPFLPGSEPDIRISAVGCRSVNLLKRLRAWDNVAAMRITPYRRLETWEWDNSNVEFDAKDLALPELGFMVENRLLQLGLWQQFESASNLHLYCPSRLSNMTRLADSWRLTLDSGETLNAPLVIGADGANSMVRKLAGIGVTGWQYRQWCMLMLIKTDLPQQDITWQRFYPSGPRAFLPLSEGYATLVWYDAPSRIRQLQSMSHSELTEEVRKAFPERLGNFDVKGAGSFPLVRRHAQRYVKDGIVLVGDAAHTINPLAGQGVNLGYRDVETLLDVLSEAQKRGENSASNDVLKRYERRRYPDNLLMQTGMDVFYSAFSNNLLPVAMIRNATLMIAERSGGLKTQALKYALGI
ncbi:2-octaprenyl-3-methyl-6-methoxy-1,4-benzoquinol hydroxylase [Leminorella richardii]|uniref:2-octaprenyl-3-methyl-6-methoxy-1,4-benzoquinol hydroxylase n=2 Tax=Leminorella richardii TaxID=158841 RepID=A0A2X4V4E8_9GAMM|nr:2-octaprenyl-3-methyl-6-methoxy-1,4-benzoquinol hydroxylase [Leminorella richardii]